MLYERVLLILDLEGDLSITEYVIFEQSKTTHYKRLKRLKPPGPTQTKTVRLDYRKEIMEYLEDPKYIDECFLTLSPESKSLPARVREILHGIVS